MNWSARIRDAVADRSDQLVDVSHQIHSKPELGFEEYFAHDLLTGHLEAAGFEVERHAAGLDTAFIASRGQGPAVGVICEFDALPEIGHGCGHNVIAASGLGAAVAAADFAAEAGGRIVVIGSPAEEGGGGKITMAEHGAFEGLTAAMMIHPADRDLTRMDVVAIDRFSVQYAGRASHAAAAPHLGRNALDAAVLGYVNVAALRQHIAPFQRVHGIITDGGARPNIVPSNAAAEWYVRAPHRSDLPELVDRVKGCLGAGSAAASCSMSIDSIGLAYDDMVDNPSMLGAFLEHAAWLGRPHALPDDDTVLVGSTDMGNVSYLLPSIHPMVKAAPDGTPLHSEDFARSAVSELGDSAVVHGATVMAMTVVDIWRHPELRAAMAADFARTCAHAAANSSSTRHGERPNPVGEKW